MSVYEMHPTPYGKLSDDELYSMYRGDVYAKLTSTEKLDLVQETVNRDAVERGMIGAPEVTFGSLPIDLNACTHEGVIIINQEMALQYQQTEMIDGQMQTKEMEDAALRTLESAIHENVHCWQEQILNGTIVPDNAELSAEYEANQATETAVLQNGNYRLGSQYLKGITSYSLFYFQSTERDAHIEAEAKTTSIMQALSEKFGTEKGFQAYEKGLLERGYENRLQEAIQEFDNPEFVKELNQTLMNQYYGTKTPVDSKIETAVKTEMTETYQSLKAEPTLSVQLDKTIELQEEVTMGIQNTKEMEQDNLQTEMEPETNNSGLNPQDELEETDLQDDGLDDDNLDDGLDDDDLDF